MTITNPLTLAALGELGCLRNDRLDTKAVARVLAERLEAQHIAETLDDVPSVQVTVGQLASGLIAADDEDLVKAIRPLLDFGGKVQQALSDGFVLCGSRMQVTVTVDGNILHPSVATRFLSHDPAVVDRYVVETKAKRMESMIASTVAMKELIVAEIPEMADDMEAFMQRLTDSWQRALGTGNGEPDAA